MRPAFVHVEAGLPQRIFPVPSSPAPSTRRLFILSAARPSRTWTRTSDPSACHWIGSPAQYPYPWTTPSSPHPLGFARNFLQTADTL